MIFGAQFTAFDSIRENRMHGSEGGEVNSFLYPYRPLLQHRQMLATFGMNQIAAALQHKITAS